MPTMKPAWLFVPGDRPDRYTKAAERSDIVIVDFEDAVAPDDKAAARRSFLNFQNGPDALSPDRTVIRVNPVDSPSFAEDRKLIGELSGRYSYMLPKVESAEDTEKLAALKVIALIETAAGVVNVGEIAASPNVTTLMWGAEDLTADLGGGSSRKADGTYRDFARVARANMLLAAKANGKYALDSIWADIPNLEGLRAEAEDAVESGFDGKVSIHPNHIEVVRTAFAPTADQIHWALGVLKKAETSNGVFQYEGQMIDEPLLRQARRIRSRA